MEPTKLKTVVILEIAIALGAIGSWLSMFAGVDGGVLSAFGLVSLRYFTVLSNLLMAAASLVCLVFEVRMLRGEPCGLPRWAVLLRLAGVNAVALTLIVVLGFLGPTMGYLAMVAGPNLFLHLLVPVAAIFLLVWAKLASGIRFATALVGMIPLCLYAIFYVGNILVNGIGEGLATNDWYHFLGGNVGLIPVVLAIIGLVGLGIAAGLWKLGGGAEKK